MDKIAVGHSIKRIAAALKTRNSIFERAINRGRIDHLSDDIVTYIEQDRKMICLMDELHSNLLKEG